MVVRGRVLLAAALVCLISAPLCAEPGTSGTRPEAKQRSTEDQIDQLYQQSMGEAPAKAVPELNAMIGQADEGPGRGILLAIRGAALIGTGDVAAAARDFDASAKLAPDNLSDKIRFAAGLMRKQYGQSSIALDHLLNNAPQFVKNELDIDSIWFYFRGKGVAERKLDDQRIALAKLNYGADKGMSIRSRAIRVLIERGRTAEAIALIPTINDVEVMNSALLDRRFEPLWPQLEQSAGPHMASLTEANLKRTQTAFDAKPSVDNRQMLMTALTDAGQIEEAAKLAEPIGDTPEKLAVLTEAEAWIIDAQARALYALKRGQEADRRYDDLIRARADQSWIVSMVINRVEYLSSTGDYAAGDKLVSFTESNGQSFGSPYAEQLIRRIKLCNAVGLGQQAKVAPLLADLKAHQSDSEVVTFEGLSCAGDTAGAEKIILSLFADPDRVEEMATRLQRVPLDRRDPSIWVKYWTAIRARPAVDAAFLKIARDLPETLRAP